MDIAKAVRGTGLLVGLVAGQRLLSFAMNQVLLRYTRPEVFGVVVVGLELFKDTALFFGREGLRLALLRHKSLTQGDKKGLALIVNTAWLAAPLTALFALLLAVLTLAYQHQQQDDEGHSGEYFMALLIYSVSVVIEAACEPAYTVAQNQMNFGVRVTSEAVALVARSAVAVVSVVWARQELLGFAYAQLAYAVACLVCYYGHFWLRPMPIVSSPLDLTPHISGDSALDTPTLSLAYSFTKQSFLKHILTEGDRLVLSLQSSHFDQGVYGAVTNIGSLAVRVLFQPIEETSRSLFSKLAVSDVKAARSLLVTVCKVVTLVGLVFACFGSNYTHLLLYTLLGSRWANTDAPTVLAWYCAYVLILALNGVTEAFVYAIATKQQVGDINYLLVGFSAVFAVTGFVCVHYFGTTGLVFANCVNMALRIAYSVYFIGHFFGSSGSVRLGDLLPRWPAAAAFVASFIVLKIVSTTALHPDVFVDPFGAPVRMQTAAYVALGGLLTLTTLLVLYRSERQLIDDARRLVAAKKADKKAE